MTGTVLNTRGTRGELRGSSGAEVKIQGDKVFKFGNDRTYSQGLWIMDHQTPALPMVWELDEGQLGYTMERLYELPRKVVRPTDLIQEMVVQLRNFVWSIPDEIKFDTDAHILKVQGLARNDEISHLLEEAFVKIKWDDLIPCLSHGDPTYDNVMIGYNGDIVITDPLPATSAVPDLRSVDVGKMLQSVYGFEFIRYGDPSFRLEAETKQVAALRSLTWYNENEWVASQYWCAVHLLRAVPYMPEEEMSGRLEKRAEQILRSL